MTITLKPIRTIINDLKARFAMREEDEVSPSRRVPGLWSMGREADGYTYFTLYIQAGCADRCGVQIRRFIKDLFGLNSRNMVGKLTINIYRFGGEKFNTEAYNACLSGRYYSEPETNRMLKWLGDRPSQPATFDSFGEFPAPIFSNKIVLLA